MAFGSSVAGINGMIYLSGTELFAANAFTMNIETETYEHRLFGDTWVRNIAGPSKWSGSISGVFDQDDDAQADMVVAQTSVTGLFYPKRSDLTTYYTGSCVFGSTSHTVPGDNVETWTADFVGHSTLTRTGFA